MVIAPTSRRRSRSRTSASRSRAADTSARSRSARTSARSWSARSRASRAATPSQVAVSRSIVALAVVPPPRRGDAHHAAAGDRLAHDLAAGELVGACSGHDAMGTNRDRGARSVVTTTP